MLSINRHDFLIQCVKAKMSLHDALPCVVNMQDNIWTVDEDHTAYPHTNFSSTNSNEQIILCGSMKALDKIQQDFIAKQQN